MSESQSTWSNPVSGVLRSWVADIVLRPWFDEVSLRYVAKVYMPLSRAWAAALEGEAAPWRPSWSGPSPGCSAG